MQENNAIPFPIHVKSVTEADVKYEINDKELITAIKELMKLAENSVEVSKAPFYPI